MIENISSQIESHNTYYTQNTYAQHYFLIVQHYVVYACQSVYDCNSNRPLLVFRSFTAITSTQIGPY